MFEQLGSIHPLLPPVVGVLALLAGAVIINLIAKRYWSRLSAHSPNDPASLG